MSSSFRRELMSSMRVFASEAIVVVMGGGGRFVVLDVSDGGGDSSPEFRW
jgi:hypothetical protein